MLPNNSAVPSFHEIPTVLPTIQQSWTMSFEHEYNNGQGQVRHQQDQHQNDMLITETTNVNASPFPLGQNWTNAERNSQTPKRQFIENQDFMEAESPSFPVFRSQQQQHEQAQLEIGASTSLFSMEPHQYSSELQVDENSAGDQINYSHADPQVFSSQLLPPHQATSSPAFDYYQMQNQVRESGIRKADENKSLTPAQLFASLQYHTHAIKEIEKRLAPHIQKLMHHEHKEKMVGKRTEERNGQGEQQRPSWTRREFTYEEKRILDAEFQKNCRITKKRLRELAQELNMDSKRVSKWFSSRRCHLQLNGPSKKKRFNSVDSNSPTSFPIEKENSLADNDVYEN